MSTHPSVPPTMKIPSPDILECVFRVLRSYADFARSCAVSREWRAVGVSNTPRFPMLILTSTEAAFIGQYVKISPGCWLWRRSQIEFEPQTPPPSSPAFLRVFGKGVCVLDGDSFPTGGAIIGSFAGGWTALALDGRRGFCLFDVCSGHRIPLPDLIRTPVLNLDCSLDIKFAVMSAAPGSEGDLIGAVTSGAANVAFCRLGSKRWWPPTPRAMVCGAQLSHCRAMLPRDPVEDLICFRDAYYVLDGEERLIAYMETDDDGSEYEASSGSPRPPIMEMIRYEFQYTDVPNHAVLSRYLVEVAGKLMLIRHFADPLHFEFFELAQLGMSDGNIMIARWRRVPDLVGFAVFLRKGCSKCKPLGMSDRMLVHIADGSNWWFYP
ncbi:hypothetical protein BS78_K112000 [Paspalum vaginatum]|uniref:KIB1-4 beta-propeller domain-containing protein n=1 Tax=Paspalum vaginatum TaxID=158149 RepID=A0A9W8CFN7_9POAL|nr:hypothetical protein BS78_K112000 [Paspalum vaginatum]